MEGRNACEWCRLLFHNRFQLGPHRRVCPMRPEMESVATNDEPEFHGSNVVGASDVVITSPAPTTLLPKPQEISLPGLCARTTCTSQNWGVSRPLVFPRRENTTKLFIRDYFPVGSGCFPSWVITINRFYVCEHCVQVCALSITLCLLALCASLRTINRVYVCEHCVQVCTL